jgi:hypothetical protein
MTVFSDPRSEAERLGFHLVQVVVDDGVVFRWERSSMPRSPEFATEGAAMAWVATALANATLFDG